MGGGERSRVRAGGSIPRLAGAHACHPEAPFATWFEATPEERTALFDLVDEVKRALDERLHPDGYNIGINAGEAAGQTVPHLHVHVIPRYRGDVDDPRGGVRHVIPGKGNYLSNGSSGSRAVAVKSGPCPPDDR